MATNRPLWLIKMQIWRRLFDGDANQIAAERFGQWLTSKQSGGLTGSRSRLGEKSAHTSIEKRFDGAIDGINFDHKAASAFFITVN